MGEIIAQELKRVEFISCTVCIIRGNPGGISRNGTKKSRAKSGPARITIRLRSPWISTFFGPLHGPLFSVRGSKIIVT